MCFPVKVSRPSADTLMIISWQKLGGSLFFTPFMITLLLTTSLKTPTWTIPAPVMRRSQIRSDQPLVIGAGHSAPCTGCTQTASLTCLLVASNSVDESLGICRGETPSWSVHPWISVGAPGVVLLWRPRGHLIHARPAPFLILAAAAAPHTRRTSAAVRLHQRLARTTPASITLPLERLLTWSQPVSSFFFPPWLSFPWVSLWSDFDVELLERDSQRVSAQL